MLVVGWFGSLSRHGDAFRLYFLFVLAWNSCTEAFLFALDFLMSAEYFHLQDEPASGGALLLIRLYIPLL